MKVIKLSIFAFLFSLLIATFVIQKTNAQTRDLTTKSTFCREDSKNATFKLKLRLDKNYYKYKIKVYFYKENGEISTDKYTVKTDKNNYFNKTYSYFDIGFNTDIKVKVKKYKSVIIETKEKQEEKEPLIETTNLIDSITSGLSKSKSNNTNIELNKEPVLTTPKCETIKNKDSYKYKTLDKASALINFKDNENDGKYSQALREIDGFYDCSSFVFSAYNSIGLRFSEYVGNTETILHYMEKNGKKIKLNNLQVGDVILYFDKQTKTYKKHYKHVTHVSMYVGNGQIFEYSGAGIDCRMRNIGYYEKHSKAKAFRVLNVTDK